MKKRVRGRRQDFAVYVRCPFCPDRREQALNEVMPWCSSCGCEYKITATGATFDQSRKTPRFALAKALNLAGGIRMGKL